MSYKRQIPSMCICSGIDLSSNEEFDQDFSQFQSIRKKIKRDSALMEQKNREYEAMAREFGDQSQNVSVNYNIYEEEFENLMAGSFKTISKVGIDNFNSLSKNQVLEFQANFHSNTKRRRRSILLFSDQKHQKCQFKSQSKIKLFQQELLSFYSVSDMAHLQKRGQLDIGSFDEISEKIKKHQPSYSPVSSNSLNTQMMNEMSDFNLKDQNQLDQVDLKKIVQKALIKNVKFTANLFVRKLSSKQQKFLQTEKIYKILDVDGFTIVGFYVQNQKIRINLPKPITNKQFEKKFVLIAQPPSNIHNSKEQTTLEHGVEFRGQIYNCHTFIWEQISFLISEIKDNFRKQACRNEQIENANTENMRNRSNQYNFTYASFTTHKIQKH